MKTIRELRKQAELSQVELARKLGVDQSYISRIENGIWPLTDSVLQMKLSEALGMPLSDIAPSDMPCHKHFPTVVHGKIVHKASEFYDALKESAEHCESCRKQLQDWSKALKKELAEAVWWTYLMSLDMPDREAVLRSFQDGGDPLGCSCPLHLLRLYGGKGKERCL